MNSDNHFEKHFNYGSFLPLVLFILGIYTSYLFIITNYSQGVFIMLLALVVYVINNLINNLNENTTLFNAYLEDMAVFVTFGIAPIVFGLNFYEQDLIILSVVFFYAISQVLGLARNYVSRDKNTKGWPAPLNGLFFPFIFYIYIFYLQDPGKSIFIFYYIVVGALSVSEYNFLGYNNEKRDEKRRNEESEAQNDESNTIHSLHDLVKNYKDARKEKQEITEKEEKKNLNEIEEKNEIKKLKNIFDKERKNKILEEEEILEEFEEFEEIKKNKNTKDLGLEILSPAENKKKWYEFSFFSKKYKK